MSEDETGSTAARGAMRAARARTRVVRRRLAAVAATVALVALSIGGLAVTSANARYATGGSGLYLGAIDWFDWGTADLEVFNGMTRTNTRTVGGSVLETRCTLTGEIGDVRTYQPGQWQGDSLDDLYNIGGTGSDNQLISGLYNWDDGALVGFDISCSVTLDGVPVEIQGLVVADAEASNDYPGTPQLDEYIEATPHQPTVWRVIDRHRDCETSVLAQLAPSGTLRLGPDEVECTYRTEGGSGPMVVAFMDGATSATVSLQGGGRSAVAVGVVLEADFGDAPAGYSPAGAVYDRGWQGGVIPLGTTNVSASSFTLATPATPSLLLGSAIDPEGEPASSADATGDDAAGVDDEDAVGALAPATSLPGTNHTVTVACAGTGYVAGWIDWNRDGVFSAGEKSANAACASGSASLSWTVPADVVSGDTFVRLRIAPDTARLVPVGVRFAGEVEDHALRIDPVLSVQKSFPDGRAHPDDQVTLEILSGSTPIGTPGTTTGAESGVQNQSASEIAGPAAVLAGGSYTVAERMVAGSGGTLADYAVTWECTDDAGAVVGSGAGPSGAFTVPDAVQSDSPAFVCTFTNTPIGWTVAKSATVGGSPAPGGVVHPGDVLTYAVTATSTGSADVPGVVLIDDLADVLDDATFVAGSATLTIGSGAPQAVADPGASGGPGQLETAPFTLPAGETAVLAYQVTVAADAWLRELTNTVTGSGGPGGTVPPADCYAGQEPLGDACRTTHTTNAAFQIEKLGESDEGTWVRMDGSGFVVLADDAGAPGAALELDVQEAGVGLFAVVDVPAGTYWLSETEAPSGFSLLAAPVRFTVHPDGTVTVAAADGVVTASGSVITVRDVPALALPTTGGTGTAPFTLGGAMLLASAGGLMIIRHRNGRRHISRVT